MLNETIYAYPVKIYIRLKMDVLMQLNALGCSKEVYHNGLFLLKMAKATNIFLFKFKYI